MEVKCKVCGTINDGETNFCKGCFVKLDVENPENVSYNPKENEISASIVEKEENVIPWNEEVINEQQNIISNEIEQNNEIKVEEQNIEPIKEEQNPKIIVENNEKQEDMTFDFQPIQEEKIVEQVLEPMNFEPMENEQNIEPIEFEPIKDSEENVVSNENRTNLEKTEIIDFDTIMDVYNNELQNNENKTEEQNIEPIKEEQIEETNLETKENDISIQQEENAQNMEITSELQEVEPEPSFDDNQEIETIPEISESNWNDNKLPELDMEQFNMETDNWQENEEETEKPVLDINYVGSSKIFFKFLLNCLLFGILFGAICIGFRYLMNYIFKLENNAELIFIVISSISSVATLLIAADRTFKKQVPLISKINGTTISILLFIALPYLLIKLAYNLYIGTTFVIFLILIALSLIILAIFFNYMRNLIRVKHQIKKDDKAAFIYGIFSILLIGVTLYGVYTYKNKDYELSFKTLFTDNENIELVKSYIDEVEKSILRNQTEIEGYEIPNPIENVEYAAHDGKKPDAMALYVNENGGVTNGTIVIGSKVYTYDGENVKAN